MNLSNDDVRDIIALLDGLPFDEVELETAHFRLVLHRHANGPWTRQTTVLSTPVVEALEDAAPETAPAVTPETPAVTPETPVVEDRDGLHEVRAPLVGTFYRAPRPGAAPYVEVGSHVQPDTVVGLIETMKLFNAVDAGVRGEVVEIVVANAQFAEQGEVLMRIAPERT